jgi:uncharacterized membrane protein
VIDVRFYQAAAVVIPILVVAAALGSPVVEAATRESTRDQRRLAGWRIVGGIVAVCFVMVAELLALVTLAAGESGTWSFAVVLAAITLLSAGLATAAVSRLVEPLRGTWLEGVEWLVILTTAVFAAAAISLALLET